MADPNNRGNVYSGPALPALPEVTGDDGTKLRGLPVMLRGRVTACVPREIEYTNARTGAPSRISFHEATVLVKRFGYAIMRVDDPEDSGIMDILDPEEEGPMYIIECLVTNDSRDKATDVRLQYQRHAEAPAKAKPNRQAPANGSAAPLATAPAAAGSGSS